MRFDEVFNSRGKTLIGTATKIVRLYQFQPISVNDMNWLRSLSINKEILGKLFAQSQKMNHRSPLQTDHQILNDAGTCAEAYNILSKLQARI